MEWLGLGLVGALVFFWWLGRESAPTDTAAGGPTVPGEPQRLTNQITPAAQATPAGTSAGLLGGEVLQRATDMNDPDGTFMDGYVAGRLTERAEARDELDAARGAQNGFDTSRWSRTDDEVWDESDGSAEEDMSDDW